MKSYNELEKFPADAYLNPENFRTLYDGMTTLANGQTRAAYAKQQYESGLKTGREAKRIYINYKGVWSASLKNGGCVTSYEGIGYHANTAELLQGFLDSGATIVVGRNGQPDKVIQGGDDESKQGGNDSPEGSAPE